MEREKLAQEIKQQIAEGLKDYGLLGEFERLPADDKERIRKALDSIFASVMGGYGAVKDAREAERETLQKGEQLAKADFTVSLSQAPHLPFFPFVISVLARAHPQDFPLLSVIPRLVAPQGDKATWKLVANVWEKPSGQDFEPVAPTTALGESPASPDAQKTHYVEISAPFKALQVWKKVTFMAQAAARTFADLLLVESVNAIIALHAGEEHLLLNGDSAANPNEFDGLFKYIRDGITVGGLTLGGVKVDLNPSGSTTVTPISIDVVQDVMQRIYLRGSAYPKLLVVHPRLVPILARLWQQRVQPVVGPGVPLTNEAVVAGAYQWPMVLPGIGQVMVVTCRWMPVRTITIGGQQVPVTDVLLLDHDEELPGRISIYTERGNAIEFWDLQPTQVAWFAPITLTYRIAAYKFTTLVVRAPILQGVITNVPFTA
ncbi:MAG: hypothetical protein QXT00_02545 [Ignisphaera sp.]